MTKNRTFTCTISIQCITGHFIRSLLVLMLNDIEGKTTMKKNMEEEMVEIHLVHIVVFRHVNIFFSVITEGVSRVAIVFFFLVKLGNSYSIGFRELTFRVTPSL